MSKVETKISETDIAKIVADFAIPLFIVFDFPEATKTIARGINIHGDIAGTCFFGEEERHGFRRFAATGNFRQIDVPESLVGETVISTNAAGINDDGYIVGEFKTVAGEYGYRLNPFDEQTKLKDGDFSVVDLSGVHQVLQDLSTDSTVIAE